MSSTALSPARSRDRSLDGGTAVALVGAAVAFNVGGALHPNDGGAGNKVAQLHDMLLQGAWWPSHLGLLASFGLFTVGFLRLARRAELAPATRRIVRVMALVSLLTTAAMVPHLFAPLGADSIADGKSSALSMFMAVDETLVNAPWALGVALLAAVGGITGSLGNRVTAVVGMVGGASFAMAAVTIPVHGRPGHAVRSGRNGHHSLDARHRPPGLAAAPRARRSKPPITDIMSVTSDLGRQETLPWRWDTLLSDTTDRLWKKSSSRSSLMLPDDTWKLTWPVDSSGIPIQAAMTYVAAKPCVTTT